MPQRRGVPIVLVILLVVPISGFLLLGLQQAVNSSRGSAPQAPIPVTSLEGVIKLSPAAPTEISLATDQAAPTFALVGLDDKTHRLQDYQGKRLVLNFWATWCAPCRIEMPLLEATYKRLEKSSYIVVGVNFSEDKAKVRQYVDDLKITFPILLDPGSYVFQEYEIMGLPTTYFIDSKGTIRAKYVGLLTPESLQQYLDLLSESDK